MKLHKKQKIVILALSIVTLIFLSAYLSFYFTSQNTIFRVRGELNGVSNTTPYTIPAVYYDNEIHTEPGVQYSIRIRYQGEIVGIYIYISYPSERIFFWMNKTDSIDYVGKLDRIVVSTYSKLHIVFTLKVIQINYEIDWIYGTLIATYIAFFIVMVVLLGKYSEKDNVIKKTLHSLKPK